MFSDLRKRIKEFTAVIILLCISFFFIACNDAKPENHPWSIIPAIKGAPQDDFKFAYNTVMFTIDEKPVYFPEFLFALKYVAKHYKRMNGIDKISDWGVDQDELDLKTYILTNAVNVSFRHCVIEKKAAEFGLSLTDEDLAEMEKRKKKDIETYGYGEYIRIVSKMYVSEKMFDYLSRVDRLSAYLFEYLYGKNGRQCTDEDVKNYVRENNFICAKYIFFPLTDKDGKKVTNEEEKKQLEKIQQLHNELKESDNIIKAFNVAIRKHNTGIQEENMNRYPNGRLMVSDYKGNKFKKAYLKTKENQISNIVKTDDGLYIIMPKPILPQMQIMNGAGTLRQRTAYDYLYKNQIEAWAAVKKVAYADTFYLFEMEKYIQ
jgi:hypothetical protein